MENKMIQLILKDDVVIKLSSDTPNIQDIIEKIVENRKTLNVDCIKVISDGVENFDKDGFEQMIKDVIIKYLETLKLEEIEFGKAVSWCDE